MKGSFKRLADYITRAHTDTPITAHISNCDDLPYPLAVKCIEALQAVKKSQQDSTYHLVLSFKAQDNLTQEKLRYIEAQCCAALEMEEHQRMAAFHQDTDNPHLHIIINQIHPTTLRRVTPYYSFQKLSRFCKRMEQELGLQIDNHIPEKEAMKQDTSHHLWQDYQDEKQIIFSKINKEKAMINTQIQAKFQKKFARIKQLRFEIHTNPLLREEQKERLLAKLNHLSYYQYTRLSRESREKKQAIKAHHPIPSWQEFLQKQVQSGNQEAKKQLEHLEKKNHISHAMQAFLAQRNQKRADIASILEHREWDKQSGDLIMRGTRKIAPKIWVALLEQEGVIYVKPISDKQATFLRKNRINKTVTINEKGIIRTSIKKIRR